MPVDHGYIPTQQWAVHSDLLNWARWVRPGFSGGDVSPMFRHYRAPWAESAPRNEPDGMMGEKVERAMSRISQNDDTRRYADALRWWYVRPCNPSRQCRLMQCSHETLALWVIDGRELVKQHLRGNGSFGRLAHVARADAHS